MQLRGAPGRGRGVLVSTRLLLIIAACLIPAIALYGVIGYNLWAERKAQLADLSVQQANLLAGDVNSIAEGARILLAGASVSHHVRSVGPECSARLTMVQHKIPSYLFLAFVDAEGQVRCASNGALFVQDDNDSWARPARMATGFTAGRFTRTGQYAGGFVPFFYPMQNDAGERSGTLVAALDLNWFGGHLNELKGDFSPFLAGGILTVADADGIVLARDVRHAEFVGKQFPPAAMPITQSTTPGVLRIKSIDGAMRLIGYAPPTPESHNLAVAVGFVEPELMGGLERALLHWAMLLAGVTASVFILTILVARHSIALPTRNLLAIAQRWQEGDLTARAPVTEERSEFGQIAAAYNMMAAALQFREEKLHAYACAQEKQVAERTRELTLANERLQREIAERQNTETALLQAQKVQAVGQLAGGIAHDFNNILQVVSGSAGLIQRRAGDMAAVRRLGRTIDDAARRGSSITRRLLAFSRREELRAEILDLRELIGGLHEVLAATLDAGIVVRAEIPDHLPSVSADRGQLETVLLNLATNARDAMHAGGELRITLAETQLAATNEHELPGGGYVVITVSDTGAGMDSATLARATEPFFTTKALGQGTGLGLAMARGFAEGSGGRLHIESELGKGTRISLCLPAVMQGGQFLPGAAPVEVSTPCVSRRTRIMLVDDDPVVRGILAEPLMDEGFEVLEVSDGPAALRLLETEAVDLLITDLAMPGPDGLTLIRAAQQKYPALPAILITGYAGTAAELAIGRAVEGRFTLLRKPVSLPQLIDQVTVLTSSLDNATV